MLQVRILGENCGRSSGDHRIMLLTITTTHRPATDLGYLLHKNPARAQTNET